MDANLIHQLCLLHLNNPIVSDFPKHRTFEQELMKYHMLNIFYNRDAEIGELARNGRRRVDDETEGRCEVHDMSKK